MTDDTLEGFKLAPVYFEERVEEQKAFAEAEVLFREALRQIREEAFFSDDRYDLVLRAACLEVIRLEDEACKLTSGTRRS